MNFTVVSIGDVVFDVYLTLHDAALHCRTDNEACELCLRYGEKILVDKIDRAVGGNAANNAVGLTRLGIKAGLLSVYGDDQIGERVTQHLDREGVDHSLCVIEAGSETRYSTIINFKDQKTALEYQVPRNYHLPSEELTVPWIYVSSVGSNYQDFYNEVATSVVKHQTKLAFAPGTAQLAKSPQTYQMLTSRAEIVFVNKEEAAKMTGYSAPITSSEQIKKLLGQLRALGPKTVVITDGSKGSFVFDGTKYYFLPILKVETVSTTGAGDAYASGFMAAIIKGLTIPEAMRWGTLNSAAVVQKIGPQTGLLTFDQITQELNKHTDLQPVEL